MSPCLRRRSRPGVRRGWATPHLSASPGRGAPLLRWRPPLSTAAECSCPLPSAAQRRPPSSVTPVTLQRSRLATQRLWWVSPVPGGSVSLERLVSWERLESLRRVTTWSPTPAWLPSRRATRGPLSSAPAAASWDWNPPTAGGGFVGARHEHHLAPEHVGPEGRSTRGTEHRHALGAIRPCSRPRLRSMPAALQAEQTAACPLRPAALVPGSRPRLAPR